MRIVRTTVPPLRRSHGVGAVAALCLVVSGCVGQAAPPPPDETRPPAASTAIRQSTGRTFYVSPSGSDANDGTKARPWRTIQKAVRTLRAGQRALVRAGTYTQDLVISRRGTSNAPITIAAYPGERVVLQPRSRSGDTYAVRFKDARWIRLRGFVIEGARGTSSTNVYFEGTTSHVALIANEIRFGQDQGVFSERTTSYLSILRNTIHDNGRNRVSGQHQSHGIYLEGRHHLVANNVVRDHDAGFGIQIYPQNVDTLVVNNTVVANQLGGIVVGGDDGVRDVVIRNNILASNGGGYGVQMDSDCPTGGVVIDHNVLYGNGAGPVDRDCGHSADGNLLADPRFVDYEGRDLRLGSDSPARNAALADQAPSNDITGKRRPLGDGYDIGAFERT